MDWTKIIRSHLSVEINKKYNDLVLDVGCGNKGYSMYGKCYTIDAWEKVNPDMVLDLEKDELPFEDNSFDYILLLDVLEHLEKEKGIILLEKCKKIVKNKIIVFTPLIWDDNSKNVENPDLWCYGNKYDYHKSLWEVDDFVGFNPILITEDSYFGEWKK
jgi:SAM-dependent methyltransferase